MNKLVRWGLVIAAVGCAAIIGIQMMCVRKEPIKSWSSPRMQDIHNKWEELHSSYGNTGSRDSWETRRKELDTIFRKNISAGDLRRLVDTCGSLPINAKDRSDFSNALLNYITMTLIIKGDKASLVKLLSTRFPDHIGYQTNIEEGMVIWGKKMEHPILLFGEAYSKCKEDQVRRHIAIIIRRAFIGSGIIGEDDSEYVDNAMQWYQQNKDKLTWNEKYGRPGHPSYDYFPESYDPNPSLNVWPRYEKAPLFVEK